MTIYFFKILEKFYAVHKPAVATAFSTPNRLSPMDGLWAGVLELRAVAVVVTELAAGAAAAVDDVVEVAVEAELDPVDGVARFGSMPIRLSFGKILQHITINTCHIGIISVRHAKSTIHKEYFSLLCEIILMSPQCHVLIMDAISMW